MRVPSRLGTLPVAVAVMTALTGLYYALVAFGNITDSSTNYHFVDHVLAMDTTFKDKDVMWRHIDNNVVVTVAYIGVIVWESLTAIILITAFVLWCRAIWARGDYGRARRLSTLGWIMAILLFLGGFVTVGGEWFQMWQSSTWNGIGPATNNTLFAGVGLILAHLVRPRHSDHRDELDGVSNRSDDSRSDVRSH